MDQLHPVAGNVIQPTDERTDVIRSRLCRKQSLARRENQRAVRANALVREVTQGFYPVFDHGHFDHDVVVERGQSLAFLDHIFKVGADDFCTDITIGDVADVYVVLTYGSIARNSFLGHQAGVGGHTVEDAEGFGFADLVEVGGIDEELHVEGL